MLSARNYETLYKLSRSLHVLDKHVIIERVINTAATMVNATWGCAFVLRDERTIDITCLVENEPNANPIPDQVWQTLLWRGLIGFVYYGRRSITLRNIANDPRWMRLEELPKRGSAVGLPLQNEKRVMGVLLLTHTRVDYFDEPRLSLLEEITSLASAALNNALQTETPHLSNAMNGQNQDDNLSASRAATSTTQPPF